jgi:tetratricopeptide (TPR) repeat protein
MTHSKFRHGLLAAALAALIAPALPTPAHAGGQYVDRAPRQASDNTRERSTKKERGRAERPAELYPDATREAPAAKASAKMSPKLQKMVDQLNSDKSAEARALADDVIGNEKSNAFDRAFAAQIGAQAAMNVEDYAAAQGYFNQAIEANGLDNNSHFNAMLALAQLQLQEDQFDAALATLDRFFAETKSQKPEHLVLKGNALYRLDRFAEAATVMKQAIDASPEPRADWMQLLMGAYIENDQIAEAVQVAETVAAQKPDDKRAQMNLAAVYLQNDMLDKSAAVLERLRTAGQLTEERDYRQLYSTYLNMEGREKDAIAAINEGLEKGLLKPEYQTYLALAQSYYFAEQPGQAIEAYKKAAPLAPDGETYLNLARALWQEDRVREAKDAAKQALAKGLKRPDDAKKILALPAN